MRIGAHTEDPRTFFTSSRWDTIYLRRSESHACKALSGRTISRAHSK